MPESDDLKNRMKDPVKNITKEVVGDIVYKITRAGARRALDELKKELKDKSFRKLQKKIESMSEEKIDKLLEKSADKVISRMTEPGIEPRNLVREIEREFRQGFKKTLSRMIKVSRLAIITTAAVLIIGTGIVIANMSGGQGGGDSMPPEVEIYLSSEAPSPGEPVTFVVEAYDDTGVDWIELIINGELVEEAGTSPLVFEGGPYTEGTEVRYSASAYDEAGNEGFSGERYLRVSTPPPPIDTIPPKVSIFPSSEILELGERVIFTAEAFDNVGISLIEILINGEIVRESRSSPVTYTGGPYDEGSVIVYSALAYDEAGNEGYSGERFLRVFAPPLVTPASPTGLKGLAVSASQVDLTWTDNADNEAGFIIERSDNGGFTFVTIGNVPVNATGFSDEKAAEGREYIYRLYAFNDAGNSKPSNTISVYT